MLRDGTVPVFERVQTFVTTAVAIVLASALFILVPFAWRGSDRGIDLFAQQIHASGIYVQSTLVVYATLNTTTRSALIGDPAIDYLLPSTRDSWQRLPKPRVSLSYLGFMQKVVTALHRHGVPIMAGTDAMGIPLVTPGSSLHRELELLSASGLTNYDVIRSATVVPARFLEKQNEFGTVATGQRADLLLLTDNPLENLAVLRQPAGVMVRGKWLPRSELDALLRRLVSN
jgi:imidazolonepropionase-like amidohydrolase